MPRASEQNDITSIHTGRRITRITDWRARRAGAYITIYGYGPGNITVRVTEIERIEAGSPVTAVDKHGQRWTLA
ncbi:MAG TPA: hypothetical protein VFC47_11435 [Caulobacteraceae bacterium]|nr:hypothetical protein [Caulobacteraceae bacterium]